MAEYIIIKESVAESIITDIFTVIAMTGGAYIGVLMGSVALQVFGIVFAAFYILSTSFKRQNKMTTKQAMEHLQSQLGG